MGNSGSRKSASWPFAPEMASIMINSGLSNQDECGEIDCSDENEGNEDDEEIGQWRQKVASTSPTIRNGRTDQRKNTYPMTMASRRSSSTYPSSPNAQNTSIRGRIPCRQRSKSIMVKKTQTKYDSIPSTKPTNSSSFRSRRASESPAPVPAQIQNGRQLQLSMAQINLVRKLWQHVRAQGENGAGISILREHLFFRCPAARQMFATDLDGVQSETAYHKRLMIHAETLSEVLDDLIMNLERAHIVKDRLKEWGRIHANIRHIGFTNSMWDVFAEALNECTLTWCRKAQRCFDAQVAWTMIVLYVTEQLKDGYYEECRRLRRLSQVKHYNQTNSNHELHDEQSVDNQDQEPNEER